MKYSFKACDLVQSLLSGISNLNTTDGIKNRLDQLSEQVTSLHKQVNFEHDTRNVEINLDPNSIRNHLRDSIRNWSSRKTELYFESESLLKIFESMIIDNSFTIIDKQLLTLLHVLVRAREVLAASWSLWSFVKRSTNAAKLQSLAFPVDCPELSLHIAKVQMAKDSFEGKELSSTPSHLRKLLSNNLSLNNNEI